jgi:hypothetical protein
MLCLLTLAASGCATRAVSTVTDLHVLHAAGEFGGASGYPINSRMVVCSGHQFAGRIRAAAVEGVPMLVGNFVERMGLDRNDLATQDDWLVLLGTVDRFDTNIIDPTALPGPGQRVVLGGLFLAGKKYTREQYWQIQPSIIEGTAIEATTPAPEQVGLVLVAVPARDYGGFSGGPAATVGEDGEPRVFGTIVYQGYADTDAGRRFVLGVAPLPADVLQRALWRSY